jgi:hypothetical protein
MPCARPIRRQSAGHCGTLNRALDVINRSKLKSPWIVNATGVCLLRLGSAKQAAGMFQGLVATSGVMLKHDAPMAFKTNFATALLASDNLAGCLSVLHEIGEEENPTVRQIRVAIQQWRQSLPLWHRLQWYLGDYPQGQVPLAFPLGNLE